MSSCPGSKLEDYVSWNYSVVALGDLNESNPSLGIAEFVGNIQPRPRLKPDAFAQLVAVFEDWREHIELKLEEFWEQESGWRQYSSNAFYCVPDELYDEGGRVLDRILGRTDRAVSERDVLHQLLMGSGGTIQVMFGRIQLRVMGGIITVSELGQTLYEGGSMIEASLALVATNPAHIFSTATPQVIRDLRQLNIMYHKCGQRLEVSLIPSSRIVHHRLRHYIRVDGLVVDRCPKCSRNLASSEFIGKTVLTSAELEKLRSRAAAMAKEWMPQLDALANDHFDDNSCGFWVDEQEVADIILHNPRYTVASDLFDDELQAAA